MNALSMDVVEFSSESNKQKGIQLCSLSVNDGSQLSAFKYK